MNDPNILNKQSATSPAFSHNLDPIDFLEKIDGFIHTLGDSPTVETANAIINQLSLYQIVTVDSAGQPRWIIAPMTITKQTIQNPLHTRIAHLLKSGGEWKGKTIQRDRVDVPSCCALPVKVPADTKSEPETPESVDMDSGVKTLMLTLTTLHTILLFGADNGGIGVFERPYGVTNMNRLKNWLEEHNEHSAWSLKDTLRVHTLDELVRDAVFTVTA